MAKLDGTVWIGDNEVPCYVPSPGQSVNAAAKELGFRVLRRREAGDVIAVIAEDGLHCRCVKEGSL